MYTIYYAEVRHQLTVHVYGACLDFMGSMVYFALNIFLIEKACKWL